VVAVVARPVPVTVLGRALGVHDDDLTAALMRNGLRCGGSVEAALREDPPVPRTRRVFEGTVVLVDLRGHPFGTGPHACPGERHATAIASAMVDLLWPKAFLFRY
jgi:hypothetical protein